MFISIGFILYSINSIAQIGFFDILGDSLHYEHGEDIIEMTNSNLVITGLKYNGLSDAYGYIIEVNKLGQVIRQLTFSDPNYSVNDLGFNSICTINNKYYVTGYNNNDTFGDHYADICVMSSDTLGVSNWNIKYGDTLVNDIGKRILTNNMFLYVLADKQLNYDPTFMKLDTNGNVIWVKSYNTPNMFGKASKGLLLLQDSTFILAGDGNITAIAKDKWMIRTDKNGDTLFSKILSNTGSGWVTNICQSYDTSFYLLGNSLFKCDYQGNLLSDIYYPEFNVAYSMCKTKDSNFVIGGYINGDFSLTKIDKSGNVIWNGTYDNNGHNDEISKVIATSDGGFVMCGSSYFQGVPDILVIKVDSIGELHYATIINPISEEKDNVIIYPNPTSGNIFIKSSLPFEQINVYSMNGQLIKSIKGKEYINISDFCKGNYVVEVLSNGKSFKQRIIRQ